MKVNIYVKYNYSTLSIHILGYLVFLCFVYLCHSRPKFTQGAKNQKKFQNNQNNHIPITIEISGSKLQKTGVNSKYKLGIYITTYFGP